MDNKNNQDSNGKMPESGQTILILVITAITTFSSITLMRQGLTESITEELPYSTFIQMLNDGKVEPAIVGSSEIQVEPKKDLKEYNPLIQYYTVWMESGGQLAERLGKAGVANSIEKQDDSMMLETVLSFLIPFIFIVILVNFTMKRMDGDGLVGVGKSNAKMYIQKETGITFRDMAGQNEAKESLVEIVDFLHNPGKYTYIGAKLPKGALLVGPPGTGKTLLARAMADGAKVPFYLLSGSDFVEMFVGVDTFRVRDLFRQAQELAPRITFIGEVSAIGESRDSRCGSGNDKREQTLSQLLSEVDGSDSSKGPLVLAATNCPGILDPVLLQPGRFDRQIIVDKPDLKERVNILKVRAKNVILDETVGLDGIALATSGAMGSDLANMINEAAILAVRNDRKAVSQKDLFEAMEVVLVDREKKDRMFSKKERRIMPYHRVGHALVSALQKDAEPVQKTTTVPRTMSALGYVMRVLEEEKFLNTKKELRAMLVSALDRRAAEELVFDAVTVGTADDIKQVTRIARAMVTQYGMPDKFGLMELATQENQYLSGRTVLNCGDATAAEVDQEVIRILKESCKEAKKLLSENRDVIDKIAEFLTERETITGKEFMKMSREMKGTPEPADVDKTAGEKLMDEVGPEEHKSLESRPEVESRKNAEG